MLRDDHTPGVQYLTERRVHEQCIAAQSPLLFSTCTEMGATEAANRRSFPHVFERKRSP
jgi:hypothetical protein